ncbi:unnamed protein product [Penicillium viridicatum]
MPAESARKRKLYSVEYAVWFTVVTAHADASCRYIKSLESRFEAANAAMQSPDVSLQLPRRASTPECAPYDSEAMNTNAPSSALNGTVNQNVGLSQDQIDFDHAFPPAGQRPDVQLEAQDSGLVGQIADSTHSAIFTDPSLSSSVNFGCEVKAMPRNSWPAAQSGNQQIAKSPDNAYGLYFESPRSSGVAESIVWPSESDAEDLLSTVMSSVGKLQHLFDPRAFADRFSRDYGRIVDGTYSVDAWYVELLLVLAVGALLKGRKPGSDGLPGVQFFTEATMRCPGLIQLRAAGTLGVEISGLSAFFLQCADRKDDAYIHVRAIYHSLCLNSPSLIIPIGWNCPTPFRVHGIVQRESQWRSAQV